VLQLRVGAVAHCVKVDDTLPGIAEGRNAGMWTVGVTLSGSPAGWTLAQYEAASPAEREALRQRVGSELLAGGAHAVIDTVADLPALLEQFERRMDHGERP
jgi:phosphonoacetaldehyde hydrolase